MTSHAATVPQDSLKGALVWSAVFHAALMTAMVVSTLRSQRGELWGGAGGGAMSVGLVRNLPGVPLPRPEVVTQSRVVDESRGLHREEPEPEPPPQVEQETPIPKFEKDQPPKYVTRPSKVLEDPTPPPEGAIPYGQGGSPSLPYTQFNMGGHAEGGLAFSGPGGAFAERFGWYVEVVRRKVSSHWLQSTIDPRINFAPRAVVTFQILRNGSIVNVELLQSSGNASVDRSALRAVLDSSPLDPLPPAYRGSHVQVEFWFEFHR